MNDSLIDNEGYPRSDIDVYAIRTARNRIIGNLLILYMFYIFELLS